MVRPIHRAVRYHDAEHSPIAFPDLTLRLHGCVDTISLEASEARPAVGGEVTYTGTVTDGHGDPVESIEVFFEVRSGPNAGTLGKGLTDAAGQVTFSYAGAAPGDDRVWARTVIGPDVDSEVLTVTWE
jgi:hypothetical protein